MKTKNLKLIICVLAFCSLLFTMSCNDTDQNVTESSNAMKLEKMYDANSTLKRQFGKALMLSLNESKLLRDLIKKRSLEQFNNDYEVLYEMIKNETVENNITVRQLILKNIGDETILNQIEINNPTLTILVPELPENSFSAVLWDTENQIPKVAIRLTSSNDVPVINQDGTETIIEAKYTPAFPIIVIKDNERVIVVNSKQANNLKTRTINKNNGLEFKFLDDAYDGSKMAAQQASRTVSISYADPKLVAAYDTYLNNDGWHRDYIYYGITPTNPTGAFSYDYQEAIRSFKLLGDPVAAYNKIADQTGDPRTVNSLNNSQFNSAPFWANYWTGGNFEFKVRVIVNSKGGAGAEIIKRFPATGQDLFNLYYKKINIYSNTYYQLERLELKEMRPNTPMFNWDLDQYATTIKIDIEEEDLTEGTLIEDSRNVEFASNFNIEGTILKKIGLKFGASLKKSEASKTQRTFTQVNDHLGEVIINFADNVYISKPSIFNYQTREYSSGLYSISVEPLRVQ